MESARWATFAVLVVLSSGCEARAKAPVVVANPFDHVFVIVMENTSYHTIIGNRHAPWINQAVKKYGVATNYFGVSHPSQPNYIGATSGSTYGVSGDGNVTLNAMNIVDQVETAGKSWTAYMQSIHLCRGKKLAMSCGNQLYERKHDPFVSYRDVQSNPARLARVVDSSHFASDLRANRVADFTWLSPDQCHDMHGRSAPSSDHCAFQNRGRLVSTGDAFLKSTVSKIMTSAAWTGNSVIFITWDEAEGSGSNSGCCDASPGGGHVLTLVISRSATAPTTSAAPYNHYSLLSTIESGWQLGCLATTCDTANVTPMTDLAGS